MAYTFNLNIASPTSAAAIYALKTLLKAAGWTVPKSSDGLTYFPASDGITGGGVGAGGYENANAWFIVQMPGSTRQFAIQRLAAQSWKIKYSPVAGFSGGSPSASAMPSATDEKVALGGGTDSSPTGNTWFFIPGTACKYHIAVGDADEGYNFLTMCYANGGGATSQGGIIYLDKMAPNSYPAEDTDPYVFGTISNSSTAFLVAQLQEVGGTTAFSWGQLGPDWAKVQGYGPTVSIGANPWTAEDDLLPLFWIRAGLTPVGYKGISTLFRFGGTARTNRDLNTGSTLIYLGNLWLPWDGATTPLV